MKTYALIQDGLVINTIVWDGPDVSQVDFGEGITYEEVPDSEGNSPSIGWSFKDGAFIAPLPTDEELEAIRLAKIANNEANKDSLLSEATQKIIPWQTKLLLGRKLTDAENTSLNAWLDYIDALDSLNANTDSDITWPTKPD